MKAISLTQPWATLVIEGMKVGEAYKQYETRSWKTAHRGRLAIHASKGFPRWAQLLMGTDEYDGEPHFSGVLNRDPQELCRGAILGTVDLVACHPTQDLISKGVISEQELAFGDFCPGRWAWELVRPVRFQHPISAKGTLGLWSIPTHLMGDFDEQAQEQQRINPQGREAI